MPKAGTGEVEMIRPLKVARDTAVKARTQAMLALKAIIVSAPAALRPGPLTTTTASAKASLRAIARRWLDHDAEIGSHDAHLGQLTERCAPERVRAHGRGTATAAERLIRVGDDPERIRSEAAFAKRCGACPVPASSGKTSRHRLNRGGHRQANAARHRVVVVRMRTHPRLRPPPHRRGQEQAGDHPPPQALRRARDLRLPLPRLQAHPPAANLRLTTI